MEGRQPPEPRSSYATALACTYKRAEFKGGAPAPGAPPPPPPPPVPTPLHAVSCRTTEVVVDLLQLSYNSLSHALPLLLLGSLTYTPFISAAASISLPMFRLANASLRKCETTI